MSPPATLSSDSGRWDGTRPTLLSWSLGQSGNPSSRLTSSRSTFDSHTHAFLHVLEHDYSHSTPWSLFDVVSVSVLSGTRPSTSLTPLGLRTRLSGDTSPTPRRTIVRTLPSRSYPRPDCLRPVLGAVEGQNPFSGSSDSG